MRRASSDTDNPAPSRAARSTRGRKPGTPRLAIAALLIPPDSLSTLPQPEAGTVRRHRDDTHR
ncbi:hypothetical protein GCM10022205_57600 [Spinactinospora alkalitolerans]